MRQVCQTNRHIPDEDLMKIISLKCNSCQEIFERSLKEYNRALKREQKNMFCSIKCHTKFQNKLLDQTNICMNLKCLKSYEIKSNQQKFCSKSCAATHNNSIRIVDKNCITCNNSIRHNGKYCDECKRKKRFNKINKTDYTTLTLQELKLKYGTFQYHAKIRGNARSNYKLSGKPLACFSCGYSLHVDICHIKDVNKFAMTSLVSEVNDINNLIALDKRCHWEFDNGYLIL